MRKLLFAVLLFAFPVFAQTTTNNFNHFSLSGSAAGFSGAGGATTAATSGISYQFTQHVSLGFQNLQVPGTGGFDMGTFQYAVPLSQILGKKVSTGLTFDGSSVVFSFLGGAGKFMPTNKALKSTVAETAGVVISLPAASSASGVTIGPIVQLQWVHAQGAGNGVLLSPDSASVAAGLGITF